MVDGRGDGRTYSGVWPGGQAGRTAVFPRHSWPVRRGAGIPRLDPILRICTSASSRCTPVSDTPARRSFRNLSPGELAVERFSFTAPGLIGRCHLANMFGTEADHVAGPTEPSSRFKFLQAKMVRQSGGALYRVRIRQWKLPLSDLPAASGSISRSASRCGRVFRQTVRK